MQAPGLNSGYGATPFPGKHFCTIFFIYVFHLFVCRTVSCFFIYYYVSGLLEAIQLYQDWEQANEWTNIIATQIGLATSTLAGNQQFQQHLISQAQQILLTKN